MHDDAPVGARDQREVGYAVADRHGVARRDLREDDADAGRNQRQTLREADEGAVLVTVVGDEVEKALHGAVRRRRVEDRTWGWTAGPRGLVNTLP